MVTATNGTNLSPIIRRQRERAARLPDGRQAAVFVVILIMIVILFGGGSYEIAIYD